MSANDFTLDELKDLANALEISLPDHIGLRLKVSQMIDNYCDHDFENTYNEREVWECSKCGIE